ncbi:hypothetical protein CEXT_108951 [Caerostris extrusa]|uniref:Uncharacterized protein n=1 Tax=Caerostris extrusa TaxID=172846 RepID=A0AAV4VIT2_CAEEX|nr:hypothetical protein CEXT_108951 [Caerostris extrusa]
MPLCRRHGRSTVERLRPARPRLPFTEKYFYFVRNLIDIGSKRKATSSIRAGSLSLACTCSGSNQFCTEIPSLTLILKMGIWFSKST